MKIPVFVSCPTTLNLEQEASRAIILEELARFELDPRALGRSDYPTDLPLRRRPHEFRSKKDGGSP